MNAGIEPSLVSMSREASAGAVLSASSSPTRSGRSDDSRNITAMPWRARSRTSWAVIGSWSEVNPAAAIAAIFSADAPAVWPSTRPRGACASRRSSSASPLQASGQRVTSPTATARGWRRARTSAGRPNIFSSSRVRLWACGRIIQ